MFDVLGITIQRPEAAGFGRLVLSRIPIDSSNLRTPSTGDDAILDRIAEGSRRSAQTRASTTRMMIPSVPPRVIPKSP
jgi:hypothetical protein